MVNIPQLRAVSDSKTSVLEHGSPGPVGYQGRFFFQGFNKVVSFHFGVSLVQRITLIAA
jgi:hypothetical protein